MIKNVIFDMGNVLRNYAPIRGILPYVQGEDALLIRDEMFGKEEWRLLDRGDISYEEAVSMCKSRLPERLHTALDEIVAHWHEYMPEDPRMVELVKTLKENGYRMYLLSNASVRFTVFKDHFEALKYFEGAIISAFYHTVKPEEKIYRILFDTYQLKPEECFFIDDNPDNVEAGRKLRMEGHVFTGDMTALKTSLDAHGIKA
jgi:putative hydrolase of the HAD superfamily